MEFEDGSKLETKYYFYWATRKFVEKYSDYSTRFASPHGIGYSFPAEEFEEIIKPDVIKGAKVNAILDHVAVSENIVATEEEVNSELAAIKNYYQLSDKQLDEFKSKHLDEFKNEIIKRKVSEFLVMNNN